MEKMLELAAELFVGSLTLYAAAGFVFAIAFLARAVSRLDRQAAGAGLGFRLMILPGVTALWPFLLNRWIRARS
jgi:hypothetical protein